MVLYQVFVRASAVISCVSLQGDSGRLPIKHLLGSYVGTCTCYNCNRSEEKEESCVCNLPHSMGSRTLVSNIWYVISFCILHVGHCLILSDGVKISLALHHIKHVAPLGCNRWGFCPRGTNPTCQELPQVELAQRINASNSRFQKPTADGLF